jgi:hypothetical protein
MPDVLKKEIVMISKNCKKNITQSMGLGLCLLALAACSSEKEQGYSTRPKALQQALQKCPEHAPKHVSCEKLSEIAVHVNALAYKLRVDQQAYGKDILALQETITAQRSNLEKHPEQGELQKSLKNNQKSLQEHLAVVRWLASPKG